MAVVRIPADLFTGSGDVVDRVRRQLDLLKPVIDFDVSHFDSKAQVDSCEVVSVLVRGDRIEIGYEVRYSASNTCSDIHFSGTHLRTLIGLRKDEFWVFESRLFERYRSTVDEF